MSVEQNKAISRRIPVEVFEQGRLDVVDEICAPNIIEHMTPPPGVPAGRDGIKAIFGMAATGKHATWAEAHFVKVVNGKLTEHWGVSDQLGMLRQLGLAPTSQAVPAGR